MKAKTGLKILAISLRFIGRLMILTAVMMSLSASRLVIVSVLSIFAIFLFYTLWIETDGE